MAGRYGQKPSIVVQASPIDHRPGIIRFCLFRLRAYAAVSTPALAGGEKRGAGTLDHRTDPTQATPF
jgi:hypothetical protein